MLEDTDTTTFHSLALATQSNWTSSKYGRYGCTLHWAFTHLMSLALSRNIWESCNDRRSCFPFNIASVTLLARFRPSPPTLMTVM